MSPSFNVNSHSGSPSKTSGAIDAERRALFGGAGAMLATSVGMYALLKSDPASALTTPASDTGWYNLKTDYHAYGDGIQDDTAAWQSAINDSSANRRPVLIPPGTYLITSPLTIPSNTMLYGSDLGLEFGCVLRPQNCPAFMIGGATSSFQCQIENIMIWPNGTAPDCIISIDNSYSIRLRNLRIYEAQSGLVSAAIKLLGDPSVGGHGPCNNIIWENLIVRNDSSQPAAPAILASRGCGTHRFVAPDLENYRVLFDWRGGQIDLLAPYTERAGQYAVNCDVNSQDTTAYLNTFGGIISCATSGFSCAIQSTTRNFNSFGTQWVNPSASAGAYAVYVYGIPAQAAIFYGMVPILGGPGTTQFAGVSGWQRGVGFPDYAIRASTSWNLTVPANSQVLNVVKVDGVQVGTHRACANMSVSQNGLVLSAYVSAPGAVTVIATNNTSSSINANGILFIDCEWM